MKLTIIIFIMIFVSQFIQAESNFKEVLVFRGSGVCDTCPDAIGDVLRSMGYKVKYIRQGELTKKNFSNAVLYVQPGGSDRILDTIDSLSIVEIKNLKNFVNNGGKYLGICAGGYLAGSKTDDDNGKMVKTFGLVPEIIEEELDVSDAKIINISWQGKDYQAYYQSGPKFKLKKIKKAKSFGEYKDSGHSMAFIAPVGKGNVGLIGPHFEAKDSWFKEDDLEVPKESTLPLLVNFINELLK
jgi:glutamine amidotransferase-like uncharacterized protein